MVLQALMTIPRMRIKAIIAAMPSVLISQARDKAWKNYIAENLRIVGENTAKMTQGSYIKVTYAELIGEVKKDTRTGNEIFEQVVKAADLRIIDDGFT